MKTMLLHVRNKTCLNKRKLLFVIALLNYSLDSNVFAEIPDPRDQTFYYDLSIKMINLIFNISYLCS